ncbi:hypothetical protein FTX61_20715 [Nitriliruptoraceae bacterium ZYF776]|nr:hypothetical protein [Profundirhabdus halotolerans]
MDGVRVPPPTRRAAAVIGYLAVTGRRESRNRLATLFWPDADPSTARGNLRVVVSNLRRCYPDALEVDRDAVGLTDPVGADADVARFARAAERGLARLEVAPAEATRHLEELAADDPALADALAGGRALPWVDAVAEAHRGLHERTRGAARATSTSDRPA